MSSAARERLSQERKTWRKDKPLGFYAKPEQNPDGWARTSYKLYLESDFENIKSVHLMKWTCHIPGKAGTDWEGGSYPLTLLFPQDYPTKPPECMFPAGFFHPNVYASGKVCLSIINAAEGWKPSITLKQVLVGIQDLLDTPNNYSPAQLEAHRVYTMQQPEYRKRVKQQAKQYPPVE